MNDGGGSRKTTSETFTLYGQTVEKVIEKIKQLIHEGNVPSGLGQGRQGRDERREG